MKQNSTILIANVNAGLLRKNPELVLEYMKEIGDDIRLIEVEKLGDTEKAIRGLLAQGKPSRIIIMGGDGTVAEACKVLSGTDVELGIFPGGTANVLALEYEIPNDIKKNAAMILRGRTKEFYPGVIENGVQGREPAMFIQMLGVGGDGALVVHTSWHMKRRLGSFSYVVSLLYSAPFIGKRAFNVEVDGQILEVYGAVASLGKYYAGRHRILPERPKRDQLGLCVIKRRGVMGLFDLAFHCIGFKRPSIEVIYASRVKFYNLAGDIFAQTDGTTFGYNSNSSLIVKRAQQAIKFIIPSDFEFKN